MGEPMWTPGPWIVEGADGRAVYGAGGEYLATASATVEGVERARTNALLMAAAPDLYATLDALVARAIEFNVSGVYFAETEGEALSFALAALAKARGDQNV